MRKDRTVFSLIVLFHLRENDLVHAVGVNGDTTPETEQRHQNWKLEAHVDYFLMPEDTVTIGQKLLADRHCTDLQKVVRKRARFRSPVIWLHR